MGMYVAFQMYQTQNYAYGIVYQDKKFKLLLPKNKILTQIHKEPGTPATEKFVFPCSPFPPWICICGQYSP